MPIYPYQARKIADVCGGNVCGIERIPHHLNGVGNHSPLPFLLSQYTHPQSREQNRVSSPIIPQPPLQGSTRNKRRASSALEHRSFTFPFPIAGLILVFAQAQTRLRKKTYPEDPGAKGKVFQ